MHIETCAKRAYSSAEQARRATRNASFRIRTYWCETCRAYHVANGEKRTNKHDRKPEEA